MALYQARVTTSRSPDEVFSYLSDFQSVAEWDPGVTRAVRLDEGPVRIGSLYDVTVSLLGRELELRYEVLEIDPPQRVVLEARAPGLRSYDVIRVESEGRGARVEYDALLDLSGPLRAFDPALQLGFDRVGRDAAQGLARALGGHWREEREGRTLVPCLWVSKDLAVPAESVWDLLTDTESWSEWGPTLAEVECDERRIGPDSEGRVRPVYGPWLPFEIEGFRHGQEWSWRVAGLPATRHRVSATGPDRCRVEFGVPVPAAPYLAVCRQALERIAERFESTGAAHGSRARTRQAGPAHA